MKTRLRGMAMLAVLLAACGGGGGSGGKDVPDLPDTGVADTGSLPDGAVPVDPGPADTPSDVPDAADCTQPATCIDCACWCGVRYGGCFQACEPIPDEIKNCTKDCSADCADVPDVTPQPDVQALDVPDVPDVKDCGPTVCYDCECQCPDGNAKPYGGCFSGCETVPSFIRDCSLDCAAFCLDAIGQPCQGEGYGNCPSQDYMCVAQPCHMCGIPPQSVCVPYPCLLDGCYLDSQCADKMRCSGENIPLGVAGQCLDDVPLPQCWTDEDCPPGATCEGESHCPPCTACAMLTKAGTCKGQGILLWREWSYYIPGDTVVPVWFNWTDEPIFLAECITIQLQKQTDGVFVDIGPAVKCPGTVTATKVPAWGGFQESGVVIPGNFSDIGEYRLHGRVWRGCQEGKIIADAGCASGPEDIYSEPFGAGPPPP